MKKIINMKKIIKWLFESPYTKCHCYGCTHNMPGWETEEYKREYGCTRKLKLK